MTSTCSAFNAKTHLGRLLDRVQAGEVVVITRHGHPVAKMVPATTSDAQSVAASLEALKQIRTQLKRERTNISRKDIFHWVREGRR
jgi:prevent-host-death family protein